MRQVTSLVDGLVPALNSCPYLTLCKMTSVKNRLECSNHLRMTSLSCGEARALDMMKRRRG